MSNRVSINADKGIIIFMVIVCIMSLFIVSQNAYYRQRMTDQEGYIVQLQGWMLQKEGYIPVDEQGYNPDGSLREAEDMED